MTPHEYWKSTPTGPQPISKEEFNAQCADEPKSGTGHEQPVQYCKATPEGFEFITEDEYRARIASHPKSDLPSALERRVCVDCGKPFFVPCDTDGYSSVALKYKQRCDPCVEAMAKERKKESSAKSVAADLTRRVLHFEEACPPAYRELDLGKLPAAGMKAKDAILGWVFGSRGLLIKGRTRTGKTRLAWALCRRLVLEQGRKLIAFSGGQFGRECAAAYARGAEVGKDWWQILADSEVLFLDDLGKVKFTDRVESELFDLVEYRTSHLLPIIATTNDTGETLAARMSGDRGAPLIERLREFCQVVNVA